MKARIDYYCKPAKKNADYELENIYLDVDLPFAPLVGTFVKFTPKGDYIEVVDIHLDLSVPDICLMVGLEEPEGMKLWTWEAMRLEGWKK